MIYLPTRVYHILKFQFDTGIDTKPYMKLIFPHMNTDHNWFLKVLYYKNPQKFWHHSLYSCKISQTSRSKRIKKGLKMVQQWFNKGSTLIAND